MSKYTVAGFIDFVNSQDDDTPIDHNSWATCSVGDYITSTVNAPLISDIEGLANDFSDNLLDKVLFTKEAQEKYLCGCPTTTLHDVLNNGDLVELRDYKALKTLLANLE